LRIALQAIPRNYLPHISAGREEDLRENMAMLEKKQIAFTKVLADPVWKVSKKKNPQKEEFFRMLERSELRMQ